MKWQGRDQFSIRISVMILVCFAGSGALFAGTGAQPVSEWLVESVIDHVNVGPHMDVATDPETGTTFVSYYDGVNGDLYLARSRGLGPGNCGPANDWHCQLLDSTGDVGQYNSVAVGAEGPWGWVWVAYYDATNAALKVVFGEYYRPTGGFSFSVRTVDSGSPGGPYKGKHTAIALGPTGYPHIAYQYSNDFSHINEAQLYAYQVAPGTGNCGKGGEAGRWQCDVITSDEGVGQYAAIDVEGYLRVTIAYFDGDRGHPLVATTTESTGNCGPSNTWLCRSVQNAGHVTGKFLSLYTEENGHPHIAYYNETDETLEYATYVVSGGNCGFSSGSMQWEWQCDWIDDMGASITSMGIAIEEDGSGSPVIAYQDATSLIGPATLKLARPYAATDWNPTPNCGPIDLFYTWFCEQMDTGGAYLSEASEVSMDVSSGGYATVAYREVDSYPFPAEGSVKIAMEPRLVFEDGFESGNTSVWSSMVP